MHRCINCNSPRVTRQGDEFTCEQCQYRWDVAHEQANAAYLASQGRTPAQPVTEAETSSTLEVALGLNDPDPLGAALLKHTVTEIEGLAQKAGVDLADARLKDEKVAVLVASGKVALDKDGVAVVSGD